MARKKDTNNGNELAGMIAQREDLAQRLAQTERDARDLDPVLQWEDLSRLATTAGTLERALSVLDTRIDEAQRLAAAVERQEREDAIAQRRMDAIQNLITVSEQLAAQVQHWRGGILADLEAAIHELQMTGGYPPGAAAVAWSIAEAVDNAMTRWASLAPEWVGLPPHEPRAVVALRERQDRVKQAEERLEDARTQAKKANGRHGLNSSDWTRTLETHAHGLQAARMQLLQLESPDLDPDEVFKRSTAGLGNELANYIGRYWEGRRAEEAAKQREEQAALSEV